MTHKKRYCAHCGVAYWYQASGYGCGDPTNDSAHCPECMSAIIEALSKVPCKVETRWVPCTKYTFEEILKLLEEYNKEQDRLHQEKQKDCIIQMPRLRRIFPGLIKTDTFECQESSYGIIDGHEYLVRWWKSDPKDFTISKRVHWDLVEDKQLPDNY